MERDNGSSRADVLVLALVASVSPRNGLPLWFGGVGCGAVGAFQYGSSMEVRRHQDGAGVRPGSEQAVVPVSTMVERAAPEMTVFACAACGAALTGPLKRLPAVPEAPDYAWWEAEKMGPSPATVPSGYYAIETEPYGPPLVVAEAPGPVMPRHGTRYNIDGRPLVSQGPRGNIVMNPADCHGLTMRHASAACCGATPDGGLNQVCACGTLVATLCSDCCLPYELHLSPDHVRACHLPPPAANSE